MIFLTKYFNLIPVQFRLLALIVIAAIIFAAGAGSGAATAAWYFQPKLDACNQQLGQFKGAYDTVAAALVTQSKGIRDVQVRADELQAQVDANLAAAQAKAKASQKTIDRLNGLLNAKGHETKTCGEALKEIRQ